MPGKFPPKSHPALDVRCLSMRYMLEAKLVSFVVYWTGLGVRESVVVCFRDRLFRSAGKGTKVSDDRDGILVFQMVDMHRRTDRFAVCADSFFEDIQPIPI
jgi:hypothetical protein